MPSLPKKPTSPRSTSTHVKAAAVVVSAAMLCATVFYIGTLFGDKSEPVTVPPITWSAIQKKHQIETESTFETDLMTLTQRFEHLSEMDDEETLFRFESAQSEFDQRLHLLNQNVSQLSEELTDE